MCQLIKSVERTARKSHECNAWLYLDENLSDLRGELKFSELRAIAKMKRSQGHILPGEKYQESHFVGSEGWQVVRANPAINAICWRFDLYDGADC